MEYEQLRVTKADRVAICRIFNPPLNMMNARTMAELDALTRELESDNEVRAVIFTGGVERIFITHYDVSELGTLATSTPAEGAVLKAADMVHYQMMNRLQEMPKAVIAAINGTCMGGGCELALACDIRLMAKGDFGIGLPEVGIGILPGGGGTQRLTRLLGPAKALEMMLQGKVVDAVEAERIGLIHQAVPAIDLMPTALALAQRLSRGAPIAQGLIKRCVYRGGELTLQEGLQVELEAFAQTLATEDAREGMKAYVKGEMYEFKAR